MDKQKNLKLNTAAIILWFLSAPVAITAIALMISVIVLGGGFLAVIGGALIALCLCLILSAFRITQFVIHIILLVASTKLANKVSMILLIVGFFNGICSIIGYFFLLKEFKE